MKDFTRDQLRESRPTVTAMEAVSFCLDALYTDRKHRIADEVVKNLTYEELIGALLLAEDLLKDRHGGS
ncbi:MAG: hypothetical protein ABR999_02780 [Methanoregula sp.]|jgi:hypothetical protein|uniref:hypothetical protein n=1 Tax=Methanoregula sp. TaxID=2052170 RepID=UPI003D0A4F6B